MSSAPRLDRFSAAGEYERHRAKVLSMLARRFPRLDADERLELYHAVWTTVLEKRQRGEGAEIENLEAYLMGGVDKLAFKRISNADSRRRVSVDPMEGEFAQLVDETPSPEDRVILMDEARSARDIIDELEPRERAVIKLRFDVGLEPDEIRARLELNERQYRRLIERASRKIVEHVAALERGARSRRQLSLLTACLTGIASERQLREARVLLEHDPKARALLRALRRSTERVAAALPLPAVVEVGTHEGGRVGELAAAAKQQLTDLATGAKHQATSAYVRASDPTPLAGARPGAVAAAVAGCIAVGGGTYCAVEGVPEPVRPVLGVEAAKDRAQKPPDETSPPPTAETPPPPESAQPPAPPGTEPAPVPAPSPAPAPSPPPEPPPPPPQEFFGNSAEASPATGTAAPSQPTAPSAKPQPAPAGGPGEFDGP